MTMTCTRKLEIGSSSFSGTIWIFVRSFGIGATSQSDCPKTKDHISRFGIGCASDGVAGIQSKLNASRGRD
jgi:hypothetical protein